eukprot:NODE_1793_length_1378_cov_37.864109_g1701_i0.p1 GENE.NODE_1793_length_1378_cov_37.864109_g1701_i0~~NODE_1793_length_1378_cov_37.864109_g1701_i0.p1  ORF type:complete len:386 (-),score=95.47 NODE_1793_length_1378_cov_37.864109_g1701_i0:176-1333(-)
MPKLSEVFRKNQSSEQKTPYTYPSGDKYTGEWLRGRKHGFGTAEFVSGNRYEGEWDNDFKHGQGTIVFVDGTTYTGQWSKDHKHGFGKASFTSGNRYEGNWVDDAMEGEGTFYYARGDVYSGQWKRGKISGFGKWTASDKNSSYEGMWSDGLRHGLGKLTEGGRTIDVEFKEGHRIDHAFLEEQKRKAALAQAKAKAAQSKYSKKSPKKDNAPPDPSTDSPPPNPSTPLSDTSLGPEPDHEEEESVHSTSAYTPSEGTDQEVGEEDDRPKKKKKKKKKKQLQDPQHETKDQVDGESLAALFMEHEDELNSSSFLPVISKPQQAPLTLRSNLPPPKMSSLLPAVAGPLPIVPKTRLPPLAGALPQKPMDAKRKQIGGRHGIALQAL